MTYGRDLRPWAVNYGHQILRRVLVAHAHQDGKQALILGPAIEVREIRALGPTLFQRATAVRRLPAPGPCRPGLPGQPCQVRDPARRRAGPAGPGSVPVVATAADGPAAEVAEDYRAFARWEARGRSPVYESLAGSVADDAGLVGFVASLPPTKRQPNLLFAAACYLLGAPPGLTELRDLVSQSRAELTEVILNRRTQTNEPARCATLLPALAQLPQPLALIEVGASAGLTLLVDKYSYEYGGHRLPGRDPLAPTLRCAPRGPVPLPAEVPQIAWRAGLDLNPLDVNDADDVRWLSWSGRARATGSNGWPPRSPWPAGIRPSCTAGTCSPTCRHWQPRRRPAPPWSCTTPPCSPTWRPGSEESSSRQSVTWGPSGCPTRDPGWCRA